MLCLDMYVLHVNTSVCYVLTCTSCEHKSMLNSTGYFKICKNEGRGVAAPSMHESWNLQNKPRDPLSV